MGLRNTKDSWGSVAKFLHWFIALLILGMIILGVVMGYFPKPFRYTLYTIHKSIGLIVLMLIVARLIWRLLNPTPALPTTLPRWQKGAAHASHGLLYLCLLGMPLSGWMMSTAGGHGLNFWWLINLKMPFIPISKSLAGAAKDAHTTLAWALGVLIVAHIIGAFYHHIKLKDNVLKRMAPCGHAKHIH